MPGESHFCETCGAQVPATAHHCPNCGAPQDGSEREPATRPFATAVLPLGDSAAPPPAPPGFFGALFDFRFDALVTPRIVRVLYAIIVLVVGCGWLFATTTAFLSSSRTGVLVLFGGLIGAFLYLVLVRVALEFAVAQFKVAENTSRLVALMERQERS